MEQKKVSPNRVKKEKIVAELSDKLAKSKGLVFTNYQGLTHVQLEKLKKALKLVNAELVVTKNTLLKLSLEQTQNSKLKTQNYAKSQEQKTLNSQLSTLNFEGPTATLFLYADPIEPLKQLAKTIREFNLPTVKLGIIDGKNLTSEQVLKLASLPPYDILITQLLFQMKMPLFRLHRALGWNMQKLVMTLKAIKGKKASSN